MEFLIFLVVIVALIVVHELGHLAAAKVSGMRVDEFGIGYPPRAAVLGRAGETAITLNWLPFGGFVKIYGEDAAQQDPRAFTKKNRVLQAFVLIAGVAMNIVLAYLLISLALWLGTPRALAPGEVPRAQEVHLAIAQVLPGSPAARAGLATGDEVVSAVSAQGPWQSATQSFADFVSTSGEHAIELTIDRNGQTLVIDAAAAQGIAPGDPSRYALGVEVTQVGIVRLSPLAALTQGARYTLDLTKEVAASLATFFASVFTLHADLSQVAGPVGIASALGAASKQGFAELISLAALISINLAFINLIPVPALDGGRLLFVVIEAITRRPIRPAVASAVNTFGFVLLILLMVVVTGHDLLVLL